MCFLEIDDVSRGGIYGYKKDIITLVLINAFSVKPIPTADYCTIAIPDKSIPKNDAKGYNAYYRYVATWLALPKIR